MLKKTESSNNLKLNSQHYRPSQSLHARKLMARKIDTSTYQNKGNIGSIMICIIYKKNKIQFNVPHKTTF